jgi:polar amino acid transport system substrate-binding protein
MKRRQSVWRPIQALVIVGWLLVVPACTSGRASNGSADGAGHAPATEHARPILRVGVARSYPPLIFEQDGQTVGLEADFAKALGKHLDRPVVFVPMFWPQLLGELRHGRLDIVMAGVSITDQRRKQVAFAEPYLVTGHRVLIRAADRDRFGSLDLVRRLRSSVAVEARASSLPVVRREIPDALAEQFATIDQAIAALKKGRVAVVVHDGPAVFWAVRQNPDLLAVVPGRLSENSLAWAVNPDNAKLLEQADAALRQWRDNGELDRMLARWLEP